MEIISIFAQQLFTFHYENEVNNELSRLFEQWNDVSYLYEFLKDDENDVPKNISKQELVNQIIKNANEIDDVLYEISKNKNRRLEDFFKPLHNQEYQARELSEQKGRKNYLRIYALKIDTNCFVITGGAIKFHHLNKDRKHTQIEMRKMDKCRDFLKDNGAFDKDSFCEFIIE